MPAQSASPKAYAGTFLGLLLLLALTVGVNFFDLGSVNLVIALLISVAKALLIALFFMEVRYSRPMVWLFASAGVVWLTIMLLMMFSDYATRNWMAPGWTSGTNGTNQVKFASPAPAQP